MKPGLQKSNNKIVQFGQMYEMDITNPDISVV